MASLLSTLWPSFGAVQPIVLRPYPLFKCLSSLFNRCICTTFRSLCAPANQSSLPSESRAFSPPLTNANPDRCTVLSLAIESPVFEIQPLLNPSACESDIRPKELRQCVGVWQGPSRFSFRSVRTYVRRYSSSPPYSRPQTERNSFT